MKKFFITLVNLTHKLLQPGKDSLSKETFPHSFKSPEFSFVMLWCPHFTSVWVIQYQYTLIFKHNKRKQ